MVGSEYTYCPMCGCEDGQGCSKDCPSEVMPRLLAENAKLRAALIAWMDAVRIDATMEGPVYMGISSTLGRKAWEQTRAALAQGGE